uniref:NADH-ubiquinone oxidoreductase chain 4 n=1 Tax=Lachesilla pedicularia TaxID=1897924 RepID=A0A8K1ZFT1_9NEOP|nr:NADH dehydrogenase subunit 4 [Lachesilla pedicularia]
MLKFGMMILFMIPYIFCEWEILQSLFMLLTVFFIFELGVFEFFESLSYFGGLDLMSYTLILLTLWICFLMILSSETIMKNKFFSNQFLFMLLLLMLFLLMSFYSMNVFMFYIMFEASLIPTFFLILGWGYQSERLQASVYLLMYTLIFSLPLMIMIFYIFFDLGTVSMMFGMEFMEKKINLLMFIMTYFAFLVKLPLFSLHLWLPKAHVEAPVSGSMILAGVLLKLGGYGIIRVSKMLYKNMIHYSTYFIIISLVGGVLISLNCLRQSDLKLLIAYSSVSHMGVMLSGLFTFSYWGLSSALVIMLSHGLCSSGLFFLTNVCYERLGSRSMLFVKGMIHFMPKMSLWWFFFCCMNMAAPPSLNLLGEIAAINSLVNWSWLTMFSLGLMGFFVAGYSLYLFSFSQHGKIGTSIFSFCSNTLREFLIVFLHWIPLNILILFSEIFFCWI